MEDLLCDPPEQTVVGSVFNRRRELKSSDFKIEVDVSECDRYATIHHWNVYTGDDCDTGSDISLPNSIDLDVPTVTLTERVLDYGIYCFRLTSEFETKPVETHVDIVVEIVHSDLVAIIDGGNSRTVTNVDDLLIDGSTSYDPDLPSYAVDHNLSYTWFCSASVSQYQHMSKLLSMSKVYSC